MPKPRAIVSIEAGRSNRAAPVGEAILKHLDGLYRFALRLTRDLELARDLTQESVLRALEREGVIVHDLRAWLFQTLFHTFVSEYRRLRHVTPVEEAGELADRPSESFGAAHTLIALEDVRAAISVLPEELRIVVWLSDAEEFRLREIAEILGWPVGTVASRLWRARQELRRALSIYASPHENQV